MLRHVIASNSEGGPYLLFNWKAIAWGRTDHFSTKNSTNKQRAGCYLFTVSNANLLFSHGRFILPCNVHP